MVEHTHPEDAYGFYTVDGDLISAWFCYECCEYELWKNVPPYVVPTHEHAQLCCLRKLSKGNFYALPAATQGHILSRTPRPFTREIIPLPNPRRDALDALLATLDQAGW